MAAPSLCLRKRQPSLPIGPLLKKTVLHQGVYLQLTSEGLLQDYQEHKQAVPGTAATAKDRTLDPGVLQGQPLLPIRSVTQATYPLFFFMKDNHSQWLLIKTTRSTYYRGTLYVLLCACTVCTQGPPHKRLHLITDFKRRSKEKSS